jgi:hypothetical protein
LVGRQDASVQCYDASIQRCNATRRFEENDASSRFTLQNGSEVHVYHHEDKDHDFFGVGPVVGFLVDDVVKAKAEMEGAGIDFIGPIQHSETHSWNHFPSPDGNIYEIMDQK